MSSKVSFKRLHISCDVGGGSLITGWCCAGGEKGVDGDCSSVISDCIPLSATFNIVSSSFADFSAVLIFFCCTASMSVAGGGLLELSGMIWNGGLRIDSGVAAIPSSAINVSTKSFRSTLLGVVTLTGEKCPKLNIEEIFDGGGYGAGGDCGGRWCCT